ncbi:MAG: hypothetical protein P4L46_01660 [Fimbriimonas sp.]|nr:hypothetical protein [Fimbriimonas sp.]
MLLLVAVAAWGQSIFTPKWVANGWSHAAEHPKYSADGSRIVVWEQTYGYKEGFYGWSVYNVADGKVLAHVNVDGNNGTLTGVTLSPDGKTVYYGTDAGIYAYNIAAQTQTLLASTGVSVKNGPRYMDVSQDGTMLGYILSDTVSGDDRIFIYSLTTNTIQSKFSIVNTGTKNKTNALHFVAHDTRVIVSGPTLYDLSGSRIAAVTNEVSDVAVSPDQTRVFTESGSYSSTTVNAFRAADLTPIWSVSPPGNFASGSVTSDGNAIVFSSQASGQWVLNGLNTATGAKLAQTVTIPNANASGDPLFAAAPNVNQVLVGPETEPNSVMVDYNSTTGAGTVVGTFFEGFVVTGNNQTIQGTTTVVRGNNVPGVFDIEAHAKKNAVAIRNAATGHIVTDGLPDGAVVSPNGLYYGIASGSGVSVYKVSDGSLIDSTSLSTNTLTGLQWAGNQRLSVSSAQYHNEGPYVLSFDGSTLSSYKSYNFGNDIYRISPDGTIFADVQGNYLGQSVVLSNVDTGKTIATINAESGGNGIDDVTFSQNGLLGIHDSFYNSSSEATVEYRVYDISQTPPVLVRKVSYQANQNAIGSGGSLSPDGQSLIVGHTESSTGSDPRTQSSVRIYRVSDGALLSRWDNIFQPAVGLDVSTFSYSLDSVTALWWSDHAVVAAPVVPFVTSVSISPNPITGGLSTIGTITIDQAQPSTITFDLAASSGSASVAPTVSIPKGATSVTFTIQSTEVPTTQTVAILATYNGLTQSAILTLKPYTVTALTLSPASVPGGQTSVGTVTVSPVAGGSGATVTLTSSSPDAQVPATVVVPAGSATTTFNITTNPVAVTESLTVKAIIGNSQVPATLTITAPTVSSVTVSPDTVIGGNPSTGTVNLSGAAPASGIVVSLNSSSANATVPASVTVAGGASNATFTISTTAVTTSTVASISANVGSSTQSASLTIQPPALQSLSVIPTTFVGGSQTAVTGTVTLSGIAPSPGVTVTLSSSDTKAVTVPTSVTVATGATTGTFKLTTNPVTSVDSVTLKAQYQSISQTVTLTVNPFTVTGVALNPTSLTGGNSSTGTVTISQPPASAPVVVNLAISGPDGQLPATVSVPIGATTATFAITTNPVAKDETLTVTASLNQSQKTAPLAIQAPTLTSLTLAPSTVVGGTTSTGTATLTGNAPAGGITVTLSSSSTSATVPAFVSIVAGSKSAQFTITTSAVTSNTSSTITGTVGATNQTATLAIQAPGVQSLTLTPSTVTGGSQTPVNGTVTLSGAAGPSGVVVTLSSANSSVASVPATATVPAGATITTFAVTTSPVTSSQVIAITAVANGTSQSANLTVNPYTLTGFSVSPSSIAGGATTTGTVTISPAAGTAGATVNLTSNSLDAQVPQMVVVPSGATSAMFTVKSNLVNATETVTLTAAIGAAQKTASLTLTGATLSSVTLAPASVPGGSQSTGTVTLSQTAQGNGVSVVLSSSNANASLASTVLVPAGSASATFKVSTTGVSSTTTATITATLGNSSQSAVLTIQPATLQSLSVTPSTMVGGQGSVGVGTVTLKGVAAASGDIVTLTSSNLQAAKVPASVTVTGSSGSASFSVTTLSVTSTQNVTITATFNGGSVTAQVTVSPFQIASLAVAPTSVTGGNSATGTVAISQAAGSAGALVSLGSPSGNIKVPSTVTIPAGATSASFTINTAGVSKPETDAITALAGSSQMSASLSVVPPTLTGLSLAPNSLLGGVSSTGTVTITGIAPAAGLTINLSSNSSSATSPKTVVIPGGSNTTTFVVSTVGVSSNTVATISASLSGSPTQSANLTVLAASLTGLTLNASSVIGGSSTAVVGTVSLNALAGAAGDKVVLTSSNPKVANVPASVTVPSGGSTATFAVTHLVVASPGTTTISATFNGVTQTAVLSVNPFQVVSVSVSPTSVPGGTSSSGTVMLNAAPGTKSGGVSVKLTSSSKSAKVPASVSVAVGSTSGKFSITTTAVTQDTNTTIVGAMTGSSAQANLKILAPTLQSFSVSPTSVKGSATSVVTGIVTLSGIAPAGGISVTLATSNSAAATLPAKVTIPAGASSIKFKVSHSKVTAQATVTLSATLGTVTDHATLTVTP